MSREKWSWKCVQWVMMLGREIAVEKVLYPGWSAHFRIKDWDVTRDFQYRLTSWRRKQRSRA